MGDFPGEKAEVSFHHSFTFIFAFAGWVVFAGAGAFVLSLGGVEGAKVRGVEFWGVWRGAGCGVGAVGGGVWGLVQACWETSDGLS